MAFEQAGSGAAEFVQLHTMLYNPFPMWQFGKVDDLMRGSANAHPRPIHTSFAGEVIITEEFVIFVQMKRTR